MFKKIGLWFTMNAILPILVPVLFLAGGQWLSDGTFPLKDLFFQLTDSGFYIFSAATLVFSLYEEYDVCKRCISILMQTFLVLMMLVTLTMFYQIQNNSADYVNEHYKQFFITWFMTALLAGIVKYKILNYKRQLRI